MNDLPPMPPPAAESFSASTSGSPLAPRSVGWTESVQSAFKPYVNFSGRASQSQYWKFFGMNILIWTGAFVVEAILVSGNSAILSFLNTIVGFALLIWVFGSVIPSLGLLVRRLHDTNHSGWFYFVALIPIIGGIWLLITLAKAGDASDNQYGPAA